MYNLAKKYISSDKMREFFQIPKSDEIEITTLAQGEYNVNYTIKHNNFGKFVFRINTNSQMELDNQITYEFNNLNLIKESKRTPIPIYLDDTKEIIPNGVLVMSFIEGVSLDYKKDLDKAAECLADIHKLNTGKYHLLSKESPKDMIVKESEKLLDKYFKSNISQKKLGLLLEKVYEKSIKINDINLKSEYKTLINTELNSGNFLVDKICSLVDFEKAIYGDVAQDLGHFLAPTTTFWKTDIFLSKEEKDFFIEKYIKNTKDSFELGYIKERTQNFISLNCLRGLSWCSMALVEYQGERAIKNEFTNNKIIEYISEDFITKILKENF